MSHRPSIRPHLGDVGERTAHVRAQQLGSCPCLHTTPCDPDCTCVHVGSSRGCDRCCSYGSPDQQRAAAERIASALGRFDKAGVGPFERLVHAAQKVVANQLMTERREDASELAGALAALPEGGARMDYPRISEVDCDSWIRSRGWDPEEGDVPSLVEFVCGRVCPETAVVQPAEKDQGHK